MKRESYNCQPAGSRVHQQPSDYPTQQPSSRPSSSHFASFLLAVRRKSLISLICFGCGAARAGNEPQQWADTLASTEFSAQPGSEDASGYTLTRARANAGLVQRWGRGEAEWTAQAFPSEETILVHHPSSGQCAALAHHGASWPSCPIQYRGGGHRASWSKKKTKGFLPAVPATLTRQGRRPARPDE
eukprot:scaffold15464_cov140-Isochrysis_galbana.AAC.4